MTSMLVDRMLRDEAGATALNTGFLAALASLAAVAGVAADGHSLGTLLIDLVAGLGRAIGG